MRATRSVAAAACRGQRSSLLGLVSRSLRPPQGLDTAVNNANTIPFRSREWQHHMVHLYRAVLKAHQMLLPNPTMRDFGDRFVKAEFRRHTTANAKYAAIFYKGWYDYVVQLELGAGETGRDLSAEEQRLLNAEQKDAMTSLRSHVLRRKMEEGTANLTELQR